MRKRNYQPSLKTPIAETFKQYFSRIGQKLAKVGLEKDWKNFKQNKA